MLTFSVGSGCNLSVAWSGTGAELPELAMQAPGESPGAASSGGKPQAAPPALSPTRLVKIRSNSGLRKGLLFVPPAGQRWRLYYYAGGTRVAMREVSSANSTVSYLFGDHLGSTSIIADSNGARTGELRYKGWGESRYTWGTAPTKRQFTGQVNETSIGLYFFNARFYDAYLSRFVQADTIIPGAGNAQAWDRYAAMANNPLRYIDPSGHRPCDNEDQNGNCISEPGWINDALPQWKSLLDYLTISDDEDIKGVDGAYNPPGHKGTDYSVAIGSNLYASSNGNVIIADVCSLDPCVYDDDNYTTAANQGYGNVVVIEYAYEDLPRWTRITLRLSPGQSIYILYGHMEDINVAVKGSVNSGQVFGHTGDTGNSTGPHVHVELRIGVSGEIPPGQMCGTTACNSNYDSEARYNLWIDLKKNDPEILFQ